MSYADDLFTAIAPSAETISAQKTALANYQTNIGVQMMSDGRTEEALVYFKRALTLDPDTVDNYENVGNTQLQLEQNEDAIATFKKLVAMKPFDSDAATYLGNAYAQNEQWTEAAESYEKAYELDPSNTTALYSVGQSYLLKGKYSQAADAFQKVIRLSPNDANGYYALGQTYDKMGNYDYAITNLKHAISLKHEFFALAESELGYAYAGKGEDDLVQRQIDRLNDNDETTAADQLEADTVKPQFTYGSAGSYSAFQPTLGANTSLAVLSLSTGDQKLAEANASQSFTMNFYFNTDMDVTSVQNFANWSITKANGGEAGYYNYGYTANPDKEAALPVIQSIYYDSEYRVATLTFSLTQNDTADAVIDPSHLVFKFTGTDANGKSMDSDANAYEGLYGVISGSTYSYYG